MQPDVFALKAEAYDMILRRAHLVAQIQQLDKLIQEKNQAIKDTVAPVVQEEPA